MALITTVDWDNPAPIMIYPIADAFIDAAMRIGQALCDRGILLDIDTEPMYMSERFERYREREVKLHVAVGLRESECGIIKIGRTRGLRTKYMPIEEAGDLLLQMQEGAIQPFDTHHRRVVAQVVSVRGKGYRFETALHPRDIPALLEFLRGYAAPKGGPDGPEEST